MMVKNVVSTVLETSIMADIKSNWKSDNKAAAKGLDGNIFGSLFALLLAPLIAIACGILLLVVGGPLLARIAFKYVLVVAILILAGSITGLVLSLPKIGDSIGCGIGIVIGLYLLYRAWVARKSAATLPPPIIPRDQENSLAGSGR
jgi:hypothetical protein